MWKLVRKVQPWMLLIAILFLGGITAYAAQIIGVGYSKWNHRDDRSGATGCITIADANSACKLFPASNSLDTAWVNVFINAGTSAANCTWAGQGTVTLTASGQTGAGGFSAGPGAGFAIGPGGEANETPNAAILIQDSIAGLDTGFCTNPITQNGIQMYVPCRVAGGGTDCTNYSGSNLGACIAPTATQLAQAGLFAVCNGIVHAYIHYVRGV